MEAIIKSYHIYLEKRIVVNVSSDFYRSRHVLISFAYVNDVTISVLEILPR